MTAGAINGSGVTVALGSGVKLDSAGATVADAATTWLVTEAVSVSVGIGDWQAHNPKIKSHNRNRIRNFFTTL